MSEPNILAQPNPLLSVPCSFCGEDNASHPDRKFFLSNVTLAAICTECVKLTLAASKCSEDKTVSASA